jgi:hypothetical protein
MVPPNCALWFLPQSCALDYYPRSAHDEMEGTEALKCMPKGPQVVVWQSQDSSPVLLPLVTLLNSSGHTLNPASWGGKVCFTDLELRPTRKLPRHACCSISLPVLHQPEQIACCSPEHSLLHTTAPSLPLLWCLSPGSPLHPTQCLLLQGASLETPAARCAQHQAHLSHWTLSMTS